MDSLPPWPQELRVEQRASIEARLLLLLHSRPWLPEREIEIWCGQLHPNAYLPAAKFNDLVKSRKVKYALTETGEVVVGWLHGLETFGYPLTEELEILMACHPLGEQDSGQLSASSEGPFPWGRGPLTVSEPGAYYRLFRLGLLAHTRWGSALTELGARECQKVRADHLARPGSHGADDMIADA